MDSQYPALQLVPLSGITNGTIDSTKPSEEEYATPVLGTFTVHGITETKPDLNNIDLEEMATTETINDTLESESLSTPLQTQRSFTSSPRRLDSPVAETVNGVTNNPVEGTSQTTQVTDTASTAELHGVTENLQSDVSKNNLLNEITGLPANTQDNNDNVGVNSATSNPTPPTNPDNSPELNRLTNQREQCF